MTCEFAVVGLISDRWQLLGAEYGPFGCPTGPETDLGDGLPGRRQGFAGGEVAWMAAQEMVVSVFRLVNEVCLEWAIVPDSQLHYDYFRFDVLHRADPGQPYAGAGHANMKVHDAKRGRLWIMLPESGQYAFRVKGCDNPVIGSEESRQGWTALVGLTVDAEEPGLVDRRWQLFGGGDGPLGPPLGDETVGAGDYHVRQFQRGAIAAYPQVGPDLTVVAYQRGRDLEVHWGFIAGAISTETYVEAVNLSRGESTPEVTQHIQSTDLDWFGYAHDGASSGRFRFTPGRAGVDFNTGDLRHLYQIRITDFAGRVFGVQVTFVHTAIDVRLDPVPPGAAPEYGFVSHRYRMDAIVEHFLRYRLIDHRTVRAGEDITFQLVAYLYAVARDNGHRSAGQPLSTVQFAVGLRELTVGEMGTGKDYDMALKGLMTILFRYRALLSEGQIRFILGELVPNGLYGGHDITVESHLEHFAGFTFFGPETENHQLMIETSRFLVNQAQLERTGDGIYNSLDNGLTDWLLRFMHVIARHDYLEFNSRSYQRLSAHTMLNLWELSTDFSVRTGAQHLLDYQATKFAVSSDRQRHVGPFRRQKENLNRPDDGRLNDLYGTTGHPWTGFSLMYLGPAGADGRPSPWFPDRWTAEALWAGTGPYRPPGAAYILGRAGYEGVQHEFYLGHRPVLPNGEDADPGLEIYYRSDSFLISAGGMFLNSGYGSDNAVQRFTGTNGVALAQSTTLIPTRADLAWGDLIRFDPYPSKPDDTRRDAVCTGVHGSFACGANLRIAQRWLDLLNQSPDDRWLFFDLDSERAGRLGFHLAVFRAPASRIDWLRERYLEDPENFGVFYAVEADRNDPGAFDRLRTDTLAANPNPPLAIDPSGRYDFHFPAGVTYSCEFWPVGDKYRRRIRAVNGVELPESFDVSRLAEGPYLSAPNGFDGYVEIRHPGCAAPLVLDYRNEVYPTRIDNTADCPQWSLDVLRAYGEWGLVLFRAGRHADALATTRDSIDFFGRATPGLSDEPLQHNADAWLGEAAAAHPNRVPDQLDAAGNAFEILRFLAGRPGHDDSVRARLAQRLHVLAGFLAFGSPTTDRASASAALARQLYGELHDGDHRLDVAASWTAEALFHHEVSFHPANPDPAAEQARQRASAAQALAILEPMADEALSDADRRRMASMLVGMIGLLTFGAPDSGPSVRAAELARQSYAQLPGDHRLEVAELLAGLALRHHEVSFHPDQTDPVAERRRQRRAAAEAATIAIPLAEPLPEDEGRRHELATLFNRLVGLLTFGAPVPPDDEATHQQQLADQAAALAAQLNT